MCQLELWSNRLRTTENLLNDAYILVINLFWFARTQASSRGRLQDICIRWLKSCFCELWQMWDYVNIYYLFDPMYEVSLTTSLLFHDYDLKQTLCRAKLWGHLIWPKINEALTLWHNLMKKKLIIMLKL